MQKCEEYPDIPKDKRKYAQRDDRVVEKSDMRNSKKAEERKDEPEKCESNRQTGQQEIDVKSCEEEEIDEKVQRESFVRVRLLEQICIGVDRKHKKDEDKKRVDEVYLDEVDLSYGKTVEIVGYVDQRKKYRVDLDKVTKYIKLTRQEEETKYGNTDDKNKVRETHAKLREDEIDRKIKKEKSYVVEIAFEKPREKP